MCMTRTNIDIDDALVAEAMRKYGLTTKKQTVDLALRRLVGPRLSPAFLESPVRWPSPSRWSWSCSPARPTSGW